MKEEKTTWFRYSVNDEDIHEALVEEAGMVSLPQWMLFELLRSRRVYARLSSLWAVLLLLFVFVWAFTIWLG
jgi:hypothetical protein